MDADSHQHTLEDLTDWDADDVQGVSPSAKYSVVSDKIRGKMSEERMCSMFCGGKKCKYELATGWREDQMIIKGLFSQWVTDNILAMARPNIDNMKEYDHMNKFKELGITSIINLQKPGEHKSCGNGLHSLGFSYNPQEFMDNGVYFYNFGWKDYGVASHATILDMVKVMQFATSQGKVAVHCHAGLGRTGVLIACYLVFNNRMDPDEAILFVRKKRPGAIQTRGQMACIQGFGKYLVPFRIICPSVISEDEESTLHQYLVRQRGMLHGYEARRLKHLPKPIYTCCEKILELARKRHHHPWVSHKDSLSVIKQTASEAFTNESRQKLIPVNSDNSIDSLDSDASDFSCDSSNVSRQTSVLEQIDEEGREVNHGKNEADVGSAEGSDSLSNEDKDDGYGADRESCGSDCDKTCVKNSEVWNIVEALITTEYSEDVVKRSEQIMTVLNTMDTGWGELASENNPTVLSHFIWTWLHHLKEPVLRVQDLKDMLQYVDDPIKGLNTLERGSRQTVEYLVKFVARLQDVEEDQEKHLLQRLISILTHSPVVMETEVQTPSVHIPLHTLVTQQSTASMSSLLNQIKETSVPKIVRYFWRLLDSEKKIIAESASSNSKAKFEI